MRSLALTSSALLLAGCGLVLDLSPDPDDAGAPRDSGQARDAGDLMDGARPDAGDCSTTDEDGDGVSECAGDCDDGDATVHRGAPLICGDMVVNDCPTGAGEDAECSGLFVAPDGDDTTGTGAPDDPFATVQHAVSVGRMNLPADIYVAHGSYSADLLQIPDRVRVRGGFARDSWRRDRSQTTEIEVAAADGLVFEGGATGAAQIVGLTVGNSSGAERKSAVTVRTGATPQIRDCVLIAPNGGTLSRALRIDVRDPGQPAGAATFIRNTVLELARSGQATYGLDVDDAPVDIQTSRVILRGSVENQVGLHFVETRDGARVYDVEIQDLNAAGDPLPFSSVGVVIANGGARIERSTIRAARCRDECSGIRIRDPVSEVYLANNYVYGRSGSFTSAALFVKVETLGLADLGEVVVTSNLLAGGAPDDPGFAAHGVQLESLSPNPVALGRFTNNLIWSGPGDGSYPWFEPLSGGMLITPDRLEANAFWQQNGTAILYVNDDGTSLDLSALTSLFAGVPNLENDCGVAPFATPPSLDLPTGSACHDTGATVDVPMEDWSGGGRPRGAGPDIGPHEIQD